MANTVCLIYSVSSLQKCIEFEPHPMSVEIRECLSSNMISLCFRCCGSILCFTGMVQRSVEFSVWSEAEELFDSTPQIKGRINSVTYQHCNQHLPFSFHSSPQRTTKLFPTHDSLSNLGLVQLPEPANHQLHVLLAGYSGLKQHMLRDGKID